jgi:undecaprenyl-diphosphatase
MFRSNFSNSFDISLYHLINGHAGHSYLLDELMIFFAKYSLQFYAILFIVAWFYFKL